ncbi:hypothetical protein M885DRAFT_550946 [Pelagophyceae sp. CCMP2097]|nr:hypothetical protein M885DRAFT_550946 [Pelagophyceae sp. CCMP2097]
MAREASPRCMPARLVLAAVFVVSLFGVVLHHAHERRSLPAPRQAASTVAAHSDAPASADLPAAASGLVPAELALIADLPPAARAPAVDILVSRMLGPGFEVAPVATPPTGGGVPAPPKPSPVRMPQTYGAPGVIVGLEQCAVWRSTTSLFRRSATAGIFNSGTNLLTNMFRKNCVMPLECPAVGPAKMKKMMAVGECLGYPFQTPWGKHNPLAWRGEHVVDSLDHFNATEVMPVVVIKDPLTWMRSMCSEPYAAKFHRTKCCPSPLRPIDNATFPVNYKKERSEQYTSLLHLWSKWYRDYWDSPLPRLIVRYEDLLFDSKRTLTAVCQCAGGRMKPEFDYVAKPAKSGTGHGGSGTTRAGALQKYASEARRYQDLTEDDVAFFQHAADPDLVSRFGYAATDARRRELQAKSEKRPAGCDGAERGK